MVAQGRVSNGVIILEDGVRLPEGQQVTVVAIPKADASSPSKGPGKHSILDIPAVSLGAILQPLDDEDDLLGEMLEGRP